MRRTMLRHFTPIVMTASLLAVGPAQASQQVETPSQPQAQQQSPDRSVIQRRLPQGKRGSVLAFVRTELFFGTAKPDGAVTEEEFRAFIDAEVTPRFPDGLTVLKGDGQFKGSDGVIVKEQSFVLILLYPLEGRKESSKRVDLIRQLYMQQHQQQSVLRVEDPFLVWVSF